ncbi:hypothetical protein Misp02_51690 [Microtetraspora sp. NBRC 16547]|nr:hypothetical protein Misp02_51690 [Microtetraspora sp. NBRC 16547]
MSRVTRPRGRHRIGTEQTQVLSRFWDGSACGVARCLDQRRKPGGRPSKTSARRAAPVAASGLITHMPS